MYVDDKDNSNCYEHEYTCVKGKKGEKDVEFHGWEIKNVEYNEEDVLVRINF